MLPARRSILFLIMLVAATSFACGDPPDKEMQQAQGALDAARFVGADQYAREEFTAAQNALKHANEAVAQRDYRLALNHALDSRERAQIAAKMAADGKAVARVNADRAISRAAATLETLRAKISAAEASRTPARGLAKGRHVVADADRKVQEARTLYEQGEYLTATSMARAITEPIVAATKELGPSTPSPARRRR
jgi:uncharacterized protein DUF4398